MMLDALDLVRPWFQAIFFTVWFLAFLLKKTRTITVGEGAGVEELSRLYWVVLVIFGGFALLGWIDAFASI